MLFHSSFLLLNLFFFATSLGQSLSSLLLWSKISESIYFPFPLYPLKTRTFYYTLHHVSHTLFFSHNSFFSFTFFSLFLTLSIFNFLPPLHFSSLSLSLSYKHFISLYFLSPTPLLNFFTPPSNASCQCER